MKSQIAVSLRWVAEKMLAVADKLEPVVAKTVVVVKKTYVSTKDAAKTSWMWLKSRVFSLMAGTLALIYTYYLCIAVWLIFAASPIFILYAMLFLLLAVLFASAAIDMWPTVTVNEDRWDFRGYERRQAVRFAAYEA